MDENKHSEVCYSPLATRPILYTDTISGKQVGRDDMWAVTSAELDYHVISQQEGKYVNAGERLIVVNSSFDKLFDALDRASDKDYMPDAMKEDWENFQYKEYTGTLSTPIGILVGCIVHGDAPHGWHFKPCIPWDQLGDGTKLYATLTPLSQPTKVYRGLEDGEEIKSGDEVLLKDWTTWETIPDPLPDHWIGTAYTGGLMRPIRREVKQKGSS